MKLSIKPSKEMDGKTNEESLLERRLIRAPKEFRNLTEIYLGDFLDMKTTDGGVISLAVDRSYEEDTKADPLSAYVTSEVFETLFGDGSDGYDVDLVEGITLGCDPELILVSRKDAGIISANRFFTKWGAVGHDGLLMEFRPLPSTSEEVVTNNLFGLIQQARATIDKSKYHRDIKIMMTAVSAYKKISAGFHLHYGLPNEILGQNKRFIANQVVKALDYYVGIPSMLPEGSDDSYRRTVPYLEYGKPGNYRIDHRTLEYRVPGAALMKHPVLARGIMSLGAVVIEDIVSRVRHCTDGFARLTNVSTDGDIRELYPNIPPGMQLFAAICNVSIEPAMSHFKNIRVDVEKMVGYGRRSSSIEEYFKCIDSGVNFSPDVEENWWRYNDGQRQSGQVDVLRSSI